MNSLYKQCMDNAPPIMQEFNRFQQSFRGDPKQTVQQLLNSGRMTQAQFNQLSQQANQLMRYLK